MEGRDGDATNAVQGEILGVVVGGLRHGQGKGTVGLRGVAQDGTQIVGILQRKRGSNLGIQIVIGDHHPMVEDRQPLPKGFHQMVGEQKLCGQSIILIKMILKWLGFNPYEVSANWWIFIVLGIDLAIFVLSFGVTTFIRIISKDKLL